MKLKLNNFVQEEKIKNLANEMIDSKTEREVIDLINNNKMTIAQLKKLKAFLNAQKRKIEHPIALAAIYVSIIILATSIIEKLFDSSMIAHLIWFSTLIAIAFVVLKEGVPFINKTNEHNSKIEYLIWIVDEIISSRK